MHDSYWTHACTVDDMSGIIRDTFIALHSSDVLQKLYDEVLLRSHLVQSVCVNRLIQFKERYKGYKVPISSIRYGRMMEKLGMVDTKISDLALTSAIDEFGAEETEETDMDSEGEPKKRGRPRSFKTKVSAGEETEDLQFVDLVDILPPLPKKGQFDVNTIKKSLYFFS